MNKGKKHGTKHDRNAGYSGKMENIIDEWVFVERETTIQFMFDLFAMALSDEEIVGDKVLTGEELKKVIISVGNAYQVYHEAFETTPEADYWQEKLDSCLKEVFEDLFEPFTTRYPYIKRRGYGR